MTAPPSLEERVSIVEDTVARLVMSLPLPDATVRRLHGEVIVLNRETATVRQGIIDLSVEAQEIQETLDKHTKTLDEHGTILGEHTSTLNEHSNILNEHGALMREQGTLLKDVASTLKVVVAKLDAR
jgi:hypothetical protein